MDDLQDTNKKRRNTGIIWTVVVLVVLIAAGLIGYFVIRPAIQKRREEDNDDGTASDNDDGDTGSNGDNGNGDNDNDDNDNGDQPTVVNGVLTGITEVPLGVETTLMLTPESIDPENSITVTDNKFSIAPKYAGNYNLQLQWSVTSLVPAGGRFFFYAGDSVLHSQTFAPTSSRNNSVETGDFTSENIFLDGGSEFRYTVLVVGDAMVPVTGKLALMSNEAF